MEGALGTSMEGRNLSSQSDSSEERAVRISDCSEVLSPSTVVSVDHPLHGRRTEQATSVRTRGFMPKWDASNGEKPRSDPPPRKPRPYLAPDAGGPNAAGKESGVHQFWRERSSGNVSDDDSELVSPTSSRITSTMGSPVEARNVVDGARRSYSKDENAEGFLESPSPLQLKRMSMASQIPKSSSVNDADSEGLRISEGRFTVKSRDDREFSKYVPSPDILEEDLQADESELKHPSQGFGTTPGDAGFAKLANGGEKLSHASVDAAESGDFSPQSPTIAWVRREQERQGDQVCSQSQDSICTDIGVTLPRSDQSSERVYATDDAAWSVRVGMRDSRNVAVDSLQQHFHINGYTPNSHPYSWSDDRNFQEVERRRVSDGNPDIGFLVNRREVTEGDTPCVKMQLTDTNTQFFNRPASLQALEQLQNVDLQGLGVEVNRQFPVTAPFSTSHGTQDHCFGHSTYGHQQTLPQVFQSHQGFAAAAHGLPLPSVTHTFPSPSPQEATTISGSPQGHRFAYGLQHSVHPFCPFCIQQSHLQQHQMLQETLQQHYGHFSPQSMHAATRQQPLPHPYWSPFITSHIDPFLLHPQVAAYQSGAPVQIAQQWIDAREESENCSQKQKRYPPLPMQGAAPFVLCQCCNKLLQVPSYLPPNSGSIQKLRCGACMKISKFTVSQTGLTSLKNGYTPAKGHSVSASSGCTSRSVCSSAEENIEMDTENGHSLDCCPSSPPVPKSKMKLSSGNEQLLMDILLREDGSLSPSPLHRLGNHRQSESCASASTISGRESLNSAQHSRQSSASFQALERDPRALTGSGSSHGEGHSHPPALPLAVPGSPLHEHLGYMSPAGLLGLEGPPVLGNDLDKQKDDRSSVTNQSSCGSPIQSPVHASPLHEPLGLESADFGQRAQEESPHHFGSKNESAAQSPLPGSPLYEHFTHGTASEYDESLYKKESSDEPIKRQDAAGQDAGKGSKSFAGFLRRSLRELTKGNQGSSSSKQKVMINTHLVPDAMVKKAEELAGIIHPGSYWYDYEAGFWGVMGGQCLGIIPPFIEELNYPMSRDCAGGKTGVLVNGRELHHKDLEILARRGLPTIPGKSYTVEINGRAVDRASSKQLKTLGKLAPTIEKKGRGYGMFQPPSIQHGSSRNRA